VPQLVQAQPVQVQPVPKQPVPEEPPLAASGFAPSLRA